MHRVITYGTFDLLHYSYINLLRRAKGFGDYLIVALSTDNFNLGKGKSAIFPTRKENSLLKRFAMSLLSSQRTIEVRSEGGVHQYHIDEFVMGDDWCGEFDFLSEEGVRVTYLNRTPEVSTTQIKQDLGFGACGFK